MEIKTNSNAFLPLVFFFFTIFFSNNIYSQQDCLPDPEMQGVLPPPPLSQYCEDDEGHTIFFQFANVNLGTFCDMTLVSNGTDPNGNTIDYSEMRLWE